MNSADEPLGPGVRELQHTADVGLVVRGESLAELLNRTAVGMFALIYESSGPDVVDDAFNPERKTYRPTQETLGTTVVNRTISIRGEDPAGLLLAWLSELLFIHETEGLAYRTAEFQEIDEQHLTADVTLESRGIVPIREFKGVTYHDLEVTRREDGWHGRVILDV